MIGVSDEVTENQFNERRRAGLPVETDFEKAGFREAWS
jgi:hypothetical protein